MADDQVTAGELVPRLRQMIEECRLRYGRWYGSEPGRDDYESAKANKRTGADLLTRFLFEHGEQICEAMLASEDDRKDAARYRALCRYEMAAASAYSAISGNTVCPGEMDYEAWLDHELDKILDSALPPTPPRNNT